MAKDLENLLGPSEKIVLETRQHWFVIIRETIALLLSLVVMAVVLWYVQQADWLDNSFGDWVYKLLWVAFAVVAFIEVWKIFSWW